MGGPRSNRPTPPMVVYDQIGAELGVGDLVLMTQRLNKWTAMIVEIKPRLDPRSKEHLVTIQLSASFPIVGPRAGRFADMWRLQTQEETGWTPEGQRDPDKDKEAVIGDGSIIIP